MKIGQFYPKGSVIMFFIIWLLASCGAYTHTTVMPEKETSMMYIPMVQTVTKIVAVHDTIKRKPIAKTVYDSILNSAYEVNYRKYFQPEFNKQNAIIKALAISNDKFANIIAAIRARAIQHTDSMSALDKIHVKQMISFQTQSIKYQQEALQARKDYDKDIRNQTKSNTTLAIICLISVVILAGLYFSLWLRVNSIAKKIDKLNSLYNA